MIGCVFSSVGDFPIAEGIYDTPLFSIVFDRCYKVPRQSQSTSLVTRLPWVPFSFVKIRFMIRTRNPSKFKKNGDDVTLL